MSQTADKYYAALADGIPSIDMTGWEAEVRHAESHRLNNPSVMDIIGSNIPGTASRLALAADSANQSFGCVGEWMEMALRIEEKQ